MNAVMDCPICENELKLYNKEMNVYNCDSCNHSTSILPDELNEIYEKNYFIKTHKNWFDNPAIDLFDKIFNEIKALTNNKFKSILDVGCGTGSFLKHLYKQDNQLDLTGIDFITNKHKHIKFLSDDFLTMNLHKKYDVITNFMVIEHVPNPQLFVEKMRDALNKDGILIVNTINSGGLMYKLSRFLKNVGFKATFKRLYNPHHLQHFNNNSLITLLESKGLQIIKNENHNYELKAVDVPSGNTIIKTIYLLLVSIIFSISSPFNMGMHQTVQCKLK